MTRRALPIDLEQNLGFQRREWRVQQLGWYVLTAFVLAALLGLFGHGPISRAEASSDPSGLRVRYQRFVRLGARSQLALECIRSGSSETIRVRLDRRYFDRVRVSEVTPTPASIDIGASEVTYHFTVGRTHEPTFIAVLEIEPMRAGRLPGVLRFADRTPLAFTQFAYF
jgi:hypothetical protein